MRLSSSPATTLVLLLSCLARLGVRPSTSLLTTVARALDTSATQVPTPALLSLLKTCCFFGMAPVQLLVPLSGLLQRRVAAMEGDWAPGDSDLDQVAQAVWLLGRVRSAGLLGWLLFIGVTSICLTSICSTSICLTSRRDANTWLCICSSETIHTK